MMLKYGLRWHNLQQAGVSVGELLGVSFDLHESSFRGGDYFRAQVPEGTIYVQRNLDALDNEPFETSWPPDQILLCFDGLEDDGWTQYTKLLQPLEAAGNVVFLKRENAE